MRQRDRKKVIDRQSLFNIHLARFTAELNQTVEQAYRSLEELIRPVEGENASNSHPVPAIESASSEAIRKGQRTLD
jgi:hypothetical protein